MYILTRESKLWSGNARSVTDSRNTTIAYAFTTLLTKSSGEINLTCRKIKSCCSGIIIVGQLWRKTGNYNFLKLSIGGCKNRECQCLHKSSSVSAQRCLMKLLLFLFYTATHSPLTECVYKSLNSTSMSFIMNGICILCLPFQIITDTN